MKLKIITISIPTETVERAQKFCSKTARKLSPFIDLCVRDKLDILDNDSKFVSSDKIVSGGEDISDTTPSTNN